MWRWVIAALGLALLYPIVSAALPPRGAAPFRAGPERALPASFHSSWGQSLNPRSRVPTRGFRAIYFDRGSPDTPVFAEDVPDVAIKYAWADFHGINSPDFGAYWVGRISLDRAARKQITVSQSWAKSRILIDGQVAWDKSNDSGTFTHDFAAGEHVIEVEYVNNWHTVEFKVTIGDVAPVLTETDVAAALRDQPDDAPFHYVGVYESAATNTGITVTVPSSGEPAIVWLSSYEAVDWTIHSRDPVVAVVGSYAPGSRVTGAARVLRLEHWYGPHSTDRACSCVGGSYHCENDDDLATAAERLRRLTGRQLTGYAVAYSGSSLTLQPYDRQTADAVAAARARAEQGQQACRAQGNPDFDRMFGH